MEKNLQRKMYKHCITDKHVKYTNLICLNCRGLRERHKRQAVFTFLKNKGSGIFLLQETHSVINSEPMWTHGQPNSRGVAILVSRDINLTINNCDKDEFGRYLLIDCEIKNNRYILVNLYAPTIDKIAEQNIFGEYISNKLQQYIYRTKQSEKSSVWQANSVSYGIIFSLRYMETQKSNS